MYKVMGMQIVMLAVGSIVQEVNSAQMNDVHSLVSGPPFQRLAGKRA